MNITFVDLKAQYNSIKKEIDTAIQSVIDDTAFIKGKYVLKFEEEYADEKMEDINFFQSIKICFQKFFIFKGRASRSEYWWFYLFYIVTGTIPSFIPNELVMAFGWIMIILLLIPSLAVIVRRLHDINKSGWFILVSLIPLVGAIILLVKTIEKGTLGKNRFGEYPLKFKKGK